MRRLLRVLSTVLICAGLALLADGALTLLWEEPVSSLYARVQQGKLDDRLVQLERSGPSPMSLRSRPSSSATATFPWSSNCPTIGGC